MQIDIPLSEDAKAALYAQAAAANMDIEEYIHTQLIELLTTKLSSRPLAQPKTTYKKLSHEQWKTKFEELLASFPKQNTTLDDSRESIYQGCGE